MQKCAGTPGCRVSSPLGRRTVSAIPVVRPVNAARAQLPLRVQSTSTRWTRALVSALLSTQLPSGTAPKTRTATVHRPLGTYK